MAQTSRRFAATILVLAVPLLAACSDSARDIDTGSSNTSAPPRAQTSQPTENPAAQARAWFEAERRRIEAEQEQRRQLEEHRRSFVAVAFSEIDADGSAEPGLYG